MPAAAETETGQEFSINNCDAVGFDMDQTICRYDVLHLKELMEPAMVELLISEKGYPADFAAQVASFDHVACAGGLICDISTGSFIKMDSEGQIEKMYHHRDFLSREEILGFYPGGVWPHFKQFKQGEFRQNGVYTFMEDNFSLVSMSTLAAMFVHEKEQLKELNSTGEAAQTYVRAFDKFIEIICLLWGEETFAAGTSPFFEKVKKDPAFVLKPVSASVKAWIAEMRFRGKFVFLMTSSNCDFANLVMSHAYGPNWEACFDLVISKAQKPNFYTQKLNFRGVNLASEPVSETAEVVTTLKHGGWYSQGNSELLNRFIEQTTGKQRATVAYFGDSLKSDIFFPKTLHKWETVYIMDTLRWSRDSSDVSFPFSDEERALFYAEQWGPVLMCPSTGRQSLYSHIVTSNSSVVISSVENMARWGLDHLFHGFEQQQGSKDQEAMPRVPVRGFHPQPSTTMLVVKDLIKLAKRC